MQMSKKRKAKTLGVHMCDSGNYCFGSADPM